MLRPSSRPEHDDLRRRLEGLAWLLDSAVVIPGTRIRVGLDAVIGLIPGIGDVAGMALASYIVAQAARLGAPRPVLWRMTWNVALETVIGMIPLAGDVFDVAWRANARNVRLLASFLDDPRRTTRATTVRIGVVVALAIGLVLASAVAGVLVLRWVVSLL